MENEIACKIRSSTKKATKSSAKNVKFMFSEWNQFYIVCNFLMDLGHHIDIFKQLQFELLFI